jgi:hypothetical protein
VTEGASSDTEDQADEEMAIELEEIVGEVSYTS